MLLKETLRYISSRFLLTQHGFQTRAVAASVRNESAQYEDCLEMERYISCRCKKCMCKHEHDHSQRLDVYCAPRLH